MNVDSNIFMDDFDIQRSAGAELQPPHSFDGRPVPIDVIGPGSFSGL